MSTRGVTVRYPFSVRDHNDGLPATGSTLTWPYQGTSARVAQDLRRTRALAGGWSAWQAAALPTEPKRFG